MNDRKLFAAINHFVEWTTSIYHHTYVKRWSVADIKRVEVDSTRHNRTPHSATWNNKSNNNKNIILYQCKLFLYITLHDQGTQVILYPKLIYTLKLNFSKKLQEEKAVRDQFSTTHTKNERYGYNFMSIWYIYSTEFLSVHFQAPVNRLIGLICNTIIIMMFLIINVIFLFWYKDWNRFR